MQREGYLRETEGVELGIKIVIDLIEQAEEEQDQLGPSPRASPHAEGQASGRSQKGEEPVGELAPHDNSNGPGTSRDQR